uniref:SCAN box domain-containing protein n=1 Tax=Trichuris muris TaxID=70415 RepID=A0A5S6Q1J2_TRIMR
MFRKVLAKLPPAHFRMVKHIATRQPLPVECYDQLKACLSTRRALTPAERLRKLESLPAALGDLKPSELYRQLEVLYPEDVDREIIREIFLKRLPHSLSVLCREWLKEHTLAEVACRADAHCQPRPHVSVCTARRGRNSPPIASRSPSSRQKPSIRGVG